MPRNAPFLYLVVALLAIAPRVEPALRSFRFSPDAAEYALIARSLARGEGFTLPVRVRHLDREETVHDAYPERAPLFPWLLAPLSSPTPGWPDPKLQLLNVLLAALAAALAASLTGLLAQRRGLGGWPWAFAVLLGGLAVAWVPNLVRASVHLWAEPLGLVLILASLRLIWSDDASVGALLLAGVLAGLARFARPEAWVLVPLLPLGLWAAGRKVDGQLLIPGLAIVNVGLVSLTGVLAPQLELLRVASFEQTMGQSGPALSAGVVAGGIARNALGQLEYVLLPKNGFLILPLALLGLRRWVNAPFVLLAGALSLATVVVWSTSDPSRFTIAPLCLLAPVAAVEALVLVGRLPAARRRLALAVVVGAWVGVLGHAGGREWRKRSQPLPDHRPSGAPMVAFNGEWVSRETRGAPELRDPWSWSLVSGEPARLAASPP